MEVYGIRVSEAMDETVLQRLMRLVSPEKRKRIERFHRKEDAARSLLSDVMTRMLLCRKYGLSNDRIVFGYNAYGKPYALGLDAVWFNTSHAGDWVVCAVHTAPVGIDVEQVQRIDVLDIAEHFFSQEETKQLNAVSAGERLSYFYDLWTLKESYMKAVGEGLSIPLDSFTIHKAADHSIRLASYDPAYGYLATVYFKQYRIGEGYKLSVCAAAELAAFPPDVQILCLPDLLQE